MTNQTTPLPRPVRIYPTLLWWLGGGYLVVLLVVWNLVNLVVRDVAEQYAQAEGRAIAALLATEFLQHLERYPPDQWTSEEVYERLYRIYHDKARPLGVLWVQLYLLDGTVIFSPNAEWIGLNRSVLEPENELDFTQLSEPKVEYVPHKFMGPEGVEIRNAFEVYVPFVGQDLDMTQPWIFEIYVDAGTLQQSVRLLQWEIAGLFITMGVLLGGLTWYMTRQADRVIQSQMQALQKAYQDLRRVEEFRAQMTSMLAHDLKNQLGVVAGVLENAVLACPNEEPELLDLFQGAQQALQHIRIMLQNLVDVARLEEARLEVQLQSLNPQDILQESVQSMEVLLRANGNTYDIQVEPGTPPLKGDRYLLLRVLQNLIHNAVRHAGPHVHIRLKARPDGADRVVLQVEDNGVGIPPEHLPHIFDKFYQGSSSRGGSGLGLAFCKLALEAMNGSIAVESEPGRGTTFTLYLPRAS